MKKYLASLLSLILALSLVFTLVGCGSDDSKDDDEEEKKTSLSQKDDDDDMPPVEDSEDEDDEKPTKKPNKKDDYDEDDIVGDWEGTMEIEGYEVNFTISFDDDGEYVMTMDARSLVEQELGDIDDFAEELGVSETELEEWLEEEGYDSLEELWEDAIEQAMEEIDEDDLTEFGEYEFDGKTLILDGEEADECEFDGDELVFEIDGTVVELERA